MRNRFLSPLDRYDASQKLPLGHYERVDANAAVEQEYMKCQEVERRFMKQLHKKSAKFRSGISSNQWAGTAVRLCSAIKTRPPKSFHYPADKYSHAKGGKEIHFTWECVSWSTFVHELAHIVVHNEKLRAGSLTSLQHDSDFLWVEELLFTILLMKRRAYDY